MKKCMSCGKDSKLIRFCADISVIMFFYKIKDNLTDKGIFKKLSAAFIYPVAVLMHKKAKKLQPQAEKIIKTAMTEQASAEKTEASLDAAADPSAKALCKLASLYTGLDESDAVCKVAYLVGRFVYCIDSIDDIKDDVRKKNFNPLKNRFTESEKDFHSDALGILNLNIAQILENFDTIEFKRYSEILYNILFDGLYNSALSVLKKHTKNQEVANE